jgi:hypothetical protein
MGGSVPRNALVYMIQSTPCVSAARVRSDACCRLDHANAARRAVPDAGRRAVEIEVGLHTQPAGSAADVLCR